MRSGGHGDDKKLQAMVAGINAKRAAASGAGAAQVRQPRPAGAALQMT
jgi:hypothetical protein